MEKYKLEPKIDPHKPQHWESSIANSAIPCNWSPSPIKCYFQICLNPFPSSCPHPSSLIRLTLASIFPSVYLLCCHRMMCEDCLTPLLLNILQWFLHYHKKLSLLLKTILGPTYTYSFIPILAPVIWTTLAILFVTIIYFAVLGFKLRAPNLLGRSATLDTHTHPSLL